ncbi:MAG: DHA2 family efflux MFS transporter permease subunit [Nitrospinota bacterium]|nr:MAG: DHA2 family efflux MFS transporter permease subunit [Nitrospinota bacterium]
MPDEPTKSGGLLGPGTPLHKWWTAITVMLGTFIVVLSSTSVNVILPEMMTGFSLDVDEVQWVVTAYMIASAICMPMVGWLGNLFGNRNLYILSLLTFVTSSMLAGISWHYGLFIFFRILQGVGGGPLLPLALVLLNEAFPPQERGMATGLYGMGIAFGPSIGPVLGGYLSDILNWRAVFYVNVPVGVLCILLSFFVLPNSQEARRRTVDILGLLTMATFVTTLLLALSQGQRKEWDSTYILTLFGIAGIAFVAFLVSELLQKEPLVELHLFRLFPFCMVCIVTFINAMNFWGSAFLQVIMFQRTLDYTPFQTGMIFLPGALCMGAVMMVAGKLTDRLEPRLPMIAGLLLFAYASYQFAQVNNEASMTTLIWLSIMRYMSIGAIMSPLMTALLMSLPPEKVRMGSGIMNIMQQGLGGTIGIAMLATLLKRRTIYHTMMVAQNQSLATKGVETLFPTVRRIVEAGGDVGLLAQVKAAALLQKRLVLEGSMAAYQDCFLLMAVLALLLLPPTLLIFTRRNRA